MLPTPTYPTQFREGEAFAQGIDAHDPLASYRDQFLLPTNAA